MLLASQLVPSPSRVEQQFTTFGSCIILLIEFKLMLTPNESLNTIAQTIAKADSENHRSLYIFYQLAYFI